MILKRVVSVEIMLVAAILIIFSLVGYITIGDFPNNLTESQSNISAFPTLPVTEITDSGDVDLLQINSNYKHFYFNDVTINNGTDEYGVSRRYYFCANNTEEAAVIASGSKDGILELKDQEIRKLGWHNNDFEGITDNLYDSITKPTHIIDDTAIYSVIDIEQAINIFKCFYISDLISMPETTLTDNAIFRLGKVNPDVLQYAMYEFDIHALLSHLRLAKILNVPWGLTGQRLLATSFTESDDEYTYTEDFSDLTHLCDTPDCPTPDTYYFSITYRINKSNGEIVGEVERQ